MGVALLPVNSGVVIMASERRGHADPSPAKAVAHRSCVVRRSVRALTVGPTPVAPVAVLTRATRTGPVAGGMGTRVAANPAPRRIRCPHRTERRAGRRSIGTRRRGPGPPARTGAESPVRTERRVPDLGPCQGAARPWGIWWQPDRTSAEKGRPWGNTGRFRVLPGVLALGIAIAAAGCSSSPSTTPSRRRPHPPHRRPRRRRLATRRV